MVHRGPDDEGLHADAESGLSLGARRLAIIDVGGGHQPVSNEDETVWAVLNGEIYNHPALQRLLRAKGHQLASGTDTEVLVHLYEEYGDALVHALEGMYAFAIWDTRRHRLLIGRDRFGEKPLFYRAADGGLTFASELTALAAGLEEPLALSAAGLDRYYVLGYVAGEETVAAGVRQLPAGHTLAWAAESPVPKITPYWTVPERPERSDRSFAELTAELEFLLRAAVRSRLVADVPVGIFLSGGLDSTLVAAIACDEHSAPLKTFTVAYDVGAVNEDAAARTVAAALGTEHHELRIGSDEIATRIPQLLGRLDQPHADPALVALNAVATFAREHVTVAVGGEGADELFAGYPRYRWAQRADVIHRYVPAAAGRQLSKLAVVPGEGTVGRRLADVLRPGDAGMRQIDWVTERRRHAREAIYGPRLRDARSEDVLLDVRRLMTEARGPGVAARLMDVDRRQWLVDDVLAKADRASMLPSLELRTPFLDRAVAEFAAAVPTSVHLGNGGKALLRAVAEHAGHGRIEPGAKTAFRVPMAEWLRGPLSALLIHHVHDGPLVTGGWFDRTGLRSVVAEHNAGRDRSSALWPALALGLWLDGAGQAFSG